MKYSILVLNLGPEFESIFTYILTGPHIVYSYCGKFKSCFGFGSWTGIYSGFGLSFYLFDVSIYYDQISPNCFEILLVKNFIYRNNILVYK